VADVDTRTATPRDPTLTRWGLASSTPSASGATRKMIPFTIRKMLRKATFFPVFDDLEKQAFEANHGPARQSCLRPIAVKDRVMDETKSHSEWADASASSIGTGRRLGAKTRDVAALHLDDEPNALIVRSGGVLAGWHPPGDELFRRKASGARRRHIKQRVPTSFRVPKP